MSLGSRIAIAATVITAGALASMPARAETLRCSGGSVAEGDSRISVAYKCGEPLLRDSFCAPVYYGPSWSPVPEPYASTVVPCQQMEEWLYDRGPGNLMATVRFRWGKVQAIAYGRVPR